MKVMLQILLISSFFILGACVPPVVFNQPFPPNEEDLKAIPTKYHGIYMCESDSTLVIINESVIYAREPYYFEEKISYLEEFEDCQFIDGKLVMNATGEIVPVEFVGEDKVRGHFIEQDTIFQLGDNGIARPYDDHLLLSVSFKDGEWSINGLTKEINGNVVYRAINDASDLELVDSITPLTEIEKEEVDDPPRYIARPTLVEFERLFRNERIFIECETLIRVKYDELKDDFF